MAATPTPPHGTYLNVRGPLFIGFIFQVLLCGVLIVQVYIYHVAFRKDHWGMKAIVFIVFVLELLQTILKSYDLYQSDVWEYGDLAQMDNQRLAWFSIGLLTPVTGSIVQSFFGYRILKLSKSWIAPGFIWILSLFQLIVGLVQAIISQPFKLHEVAIKTKTLVLLCVFSAATTDVLIAVLLSYYLYQMKSGIKESDELVTRIIRLTIETGSLTAITAVVIIFLLFLAEGPWFHSVLAFTGKLYSNNLMVMFNRRIALQPHRGQSIHTFTDAQIPAEQSMFQAASTRDTTIWELSQRQKESYGTGSLPA
ncbi:hypothetical protein DL96DRAFT_1820264 [Flagelloscypha sp. PMI_526]|nr:hypothetical protein DL96DRAFT_1820264 [Flagelloscypha sp. PMI_526]